jgi:4-amino-4-deoxy-L-arabinose transferase-like glycosyltransferase
MEDSSQSEGSALAARRALWLVLGVALLLRVGWGMSRGTDAKALARLPDQVEYLTLGRNLLSAHALRMPDPHVADMDRAYRAPGYPLFIAACLGSVRIVRLAQALLDVSTVLAVCLIARRWLSPRRSVAAAGLIAINPYLIGISALILSETLFTAMLAWGFLLLRGPAARGRWTWLGGLAGALLLALGALVRPSAIGLAVVVGTGAALLNRGRGRTYPRWWPLGPVSSLSLLTAAVLLPWALRNHQVLGSWIWTATDAGITRYDGFNPDATGASDQRFARYLLEFSSASEVRRDEYLRDKADRWIRQHPTRALELAAVKIARTWSPIPLGEEYGRPLYRAAGLLYAIPFDLLILLGLRRRGLSGAARMFLLLPAIYLTIAAAASVGSLRYRLPAVPMMAVIAASASVGWVSRRRVQADLAVVEADDEAAAE